MDFIVPADEYTDVDENEIDQNDIDHQERMKDDQFDNVDIVSQKDMEIEHLKRTNTDQLVRIKELEMKVESSKGMETPDEPTHSKENSSSRMDSNHANRKEKDNTVKLPKMFKRIKFKLVGKDSWLYGKVLNKHKNKSLYKNIVVIQFDEGFQEEEIDFSKDVVHWTEINQDDDEISEPCCSVLHAKVLTRAQAKAKPGLKKAIEQEIKKFENFGAFKRVRDQGQFAIRTRWVFSEGDE